jgi:hypothetical protein
MMRAQEMQKRLGGREETERWIYRNFFMEIYFPRSNRNA